MEKLAPILVSFGPLVLTAIGIWLALRPPDPKKYSRWIFLFPILLFGLPTSWATLKETTSSDVTSSDTNGRVRAIQSGVSGEPAQFVALNDKYDKIIAKLNIQPNAPIDEIIAKLDAFMPHTFRVQAGEVFFVPTVSGEVAVLTEPNRPTKIILPQRPYLGEEITVKDAGGNAGRGGAITVDGNGRSIDGEKTYILPFSRQSDTYKFDGTGWGST